MSVNPVDLSFAQFLFDVVADEVLTAPGGFLDLTIPQWAGCSSIVVAADFIWANIGSTSDISVVWTDGHGRPLFADAFVDFVGADATSQWRGQAVIEPGFPTTTATFLSTTLGHISAHLFGVIVPLRTPF